MCLPICFLIVKMPLTICRLRLVFRELAFSSQPFELDIVCSIHLALARDGLIEEQAAAVLIVQAGVFRPRGAVPHTPQAGHTERLEAVCGERG